MKIYYKLFLFGGDANINIYVVCVKNDNRILLLGAEDVNVKSGDYDSFLETQTIQ